MNPDEVLLHELSLAWGCPIWKVQRLIGTREWKRWQTFYRVRPFGEFAADERAGIIAAAVMNANKKKATYVPIDFMPAIVRLLGGPEAVRIEKIRHKARALLSKKG